jgi:hypothetical protein
MERVPVIERVAELLADSGRSDAEVIVGFTNRALAARVYETDDPSAAQLSAVRRAVARLVAAGRAERSGRESAWLTPPPWLVDLPPKRHERRSKYGHLARATNPGGTVVCRRPTDEDRAARAAWEERHDRTEHLKQAKQALRAARAGL